MPVCAHLPGCTQESPAVTLLLAWCQHALTSHCLLVPLIRMTLEGFKSGMALVGGGEKVVSCVGGLIIPVRECVCGVSLHVCLGYGERKREQEREEESKQDCLMYTC